MLPGIKIDVGSNYDSNSFLFNNDWFSIGTQISYELIGLISGPASISAAKTKQDVDRLRRQALSIAVITQVHLAYERYSLVKEEYKIASSLYDINRRLQELTAVAQQSGKEDEQALIRSDTRALVALMRLFLSYADIQDAEGRLYQSLGLDFLPETLEALDVQTLAQAIEKAFEHELEMLNPEKINAGEGYTLSNKAQQVPDGQISHGNEPAHSEEPVKVPPVAIVSTRKQTTPIEMVAIPLYKKVDR